MADVPPPSEPSGTESESPRTGPSHAEPSLGELLLKAVRSLPQEEQEAVVRQLLDRQATGTPSSPLPLPHGSLPNLLADPAWGMMPRLSERGAGSLRMVPVRLSVEQHDALKQWCESNDFSMAVVIRGLVDRFLASQQRSA